MPAISIIMPVYNAANYLSNMLDSIVNQGFKNYELIALNDGSQDNSLEILKSYQTRITNLQIVDQTNSGVSRTRNKGIDLAVGKYICFLDADDYLSPDYLTKLYELAEEEQSDIMCCNYYTFPGKQERQINSTKNAQYVTFSELRYLGLATSPCNKLYKRELVQSSGVRFYPQSTYGEDYFFNWKLYLLTNRTHYINLALYGYRQTSNGATTKYHPNLLLIYSQEYDNLRSFASQRNLLNDKLILEIDSDLILRMPAILRMVLRAPCTYAEKINNIKELIKITHIQHAAKQIKKLQKSKIAEYIIKNQYIRLFLLSLYSEQKLRLARYMKFLFEKKS